jgi:rubrerythrin
MGVRITNGTEAVLYCSKTMWAFGPVFDDYDDAEAFLEWWKAKDARDLRLLTDAELEHEHYEWRKQKDQEVQPDGAIMCDNCGEYVTEWIEMESLTPGGEADKFCPSCAPRYQKKGVA